MSEEELNELKKFREEKEKAYIHLKGVIEGIKSGRELDQTDKNFLSVLTFVIKGFRNLSEDIIGISERQIRMSRKVDNLEKEVKQLRKTLDTLHEYK